MRKPQPVNKYVVCSVCDFPWSMHGDDPTLMDCIRILKQHVVRPQPYWDWTWRPTSPHIRTYTGTTSIQTDSATVSGVTYMTPREVSCDDN